MFKMYKGKWDSKIKIKNRSDRNEKYEFGICNRNL